MKHAPLWIAGLLGGSPAAYADEPAAPAPTLDRRVTIAAGGIIALPQADADDTTSTSLGVGASAVYWINPYVGVVGSLDYVFANAREDVVPDDTRIYFYSLNVGVRVAAPDRSRPQPFGQLSLGRHTIGYAGPDDGDAQSDLGVRLGGGVHYRTGRGVALVGQLTYTTAEIEGADINGFLVELGAAWDL